MRSRKRYRVEGPLLGVQVGDVITDRDLPGCNIEALVAGGHVSVVTDTQPNKRNKEPDNGA